MPKKYQILTYCWREKSLWLFGCEHSADSNDLRYSTLRKTINKFIKQSEGTSVLAAERALPTERLSLPRMTKKYLEMGFLTSMGETLTVPVISLEISFEKIVQRTLKNTNFSPEDILIWKMLNRLWWLHSTQKSQIISSKFLAIAPKDSLYLTKKIAPIGSYLAGTVITYLDAYVRDRLRRGIMLTASSQYNFKFLDYSYITKIVNPFHGVTLFNKIAQELNYAREEFLAENILTQLKRRNTFAVVGLNHVKSITSIIKKRGVKIRDIEKVAVLQG